MGIDKVEDILRQTLGLDLNVFKKIDNFPKMLRKRKKTIKVILKYVRIRKKNSDKM